MTSPVPVRRKSVVRATAVLLLAVGLTGTQLGTASAHVRVTSDSSAAGSFSAVTFRVPNESDTAGTVKVSVQLPQDTPFLYVSSKPVPGWTAARTTESLPHPVEAEGTSITKAVRTVTWTADRGRQIRPGEYQEFSLSVGPLPAPGTVLLPATQTYSDGTVVHWDQPTPPSGDEPEYPAPELVITAAANRSETGTADGDSTSANPPAAAPGVVSGPDAASRVLAGAALVVALAALVVALAGHRRRGRG